MMTMVGLFLSLAGLPLEHPGQSDSQSSVQGHHVMATDENIVTVAGDEGNDSMTLSKTAMARQVQLS